MITTKELAKICGVSRGTIDRALNNKTGINEQTRRNILETAERYGYKPNILARNLVKGRTMSLGVVIYDLNNSFFSQVLDSMEVKAREKDYLLYITMTAKNAELEKECVNRLASGQTDGIILYSTSPPEGYAEFLKALSIPVLTLVNKIGDMPFIGMNDHHAMFDATRYVIQRGYRRLIFVAPPLAQEGIMNVYAQKQRLEGFKSAVAACGDEICYEVICTGYVEDLAKYSFSQEYKTAVICSNDYFAINVLHSFKTRGISVPFDVGVMGFDSIRLLKLFDPTLATVEANIELMASLAVERIIDMIEKREVPLETNMDYKILPGQSLV